MPIPCLFAIVTVAHFALAHTSITPTRDSVSSLAGPSCYHPEPYEVSAGGEAECTNTMLRALLAVHVNNTASAGLSIAHYNLDDFTMFGGAGWKGWSNSTHVGRCMSGATMDRDGAHKQQYRTVCYLLASMSGGDGGGDGDRGGHDHGHDRDHNHDHDEDLHHDKEDNSDRIQCTVPQPQQFVSDGCYSLPEATSADIGPQIANGSGMSSFELGLAIFGALASAIGIGGAGLAIARFLCKQRSLKQPTVTASKTVLSRNETAYA